jgi:hypothetical protein
MESLIYHNIEILKNLSKLDNISILLGGGNNDLRLKNLFMLLISNNKNDIDVSIKTPIYDNSVNSQMILQTGVALFGDFNDIDLWSTIDKYLNNKINNIIFDLSTIKFVEWDKKFLELLFVLLKQNGSIYIDQTIYTRSLSSPNDLEKRFICVKQNDLVKVLLPKERYITNGFIDATGNILYSKYVLPNDNDISKHNIDLLEEIGFSVITNNIEYPIPKHMSFFNNPKHIIAIKL